MRIIKEKPLLSLSVIVLTVMIGVISLIAYIPNRNETDDNNDNELKINETTKEDIDYTDLENNATNGAYSKIDNVSCPEMSLASTSYSNFFVTNDGRLFKYDLYRLFDNDKNCKEITWNISSGSEKAVSIFNMMKNGMNYTYVLGGTEFDNSSIKQKYDRFYKAYHLDHIAGYELANKDYAGGYAFIIPEFEDTTVFQLVNNKAVIIDGVLYNVKLNVQTGNVSPKFIYNYDIVDIAFQPKEDENIMKILDSIIVTDKGIYTYDLIDDSCIKYVDGECEYGYKENTDLSRIVNEILFVDESHVILKDGTSYVITTYGLE